MSEVGVTDFLSQYRTISGKLKKRFLRKTNAAEPSDQFASLAAQCERSDQAEYAGLSWLAVARCESSLGHHNEEATALANAGRHFINAETKSVAKCREHLQGGLACVTRGEHVWETDDERPLAAGLCLATAHCLENLCPFESGTLFQKATTLLAESPFQKLHALSCLSSNKITLGDYDGALSNLSDMVATVYKITPTPFGVYSDILRCCEISRILLILILRPTPQKISPELAKLVEKYTWIGEPDTEIKLLVGEELFFLLQSLVMGCQAQDLDAVSQLELSLWKHINSEQKQLLTIIIDSMNNSEK